jgi:hypothetical protein
MIKVKISKHISNWFGKKPYTKASYITAIATVLLFVITAVAVWVAIREYRLNLKLADHAEIEKIEIQFEGGVTCSQDYKTRFATLPNMSGGHKIIMPTRWPVIICNNGQNTVSLVAYNARSRIQGTKRNIGTNILDEIGRRISLPVTLHSGESVRLYLEVPIRIPSFVFDLVKNTAQFSADFTPAELDEYLKEKHGVDFYGNPYRYASKIGSIGDERVAVHIFRYNDEGDLIKEGMQADQVTLEFRTSRDNYFSARALYYEMRTFKPQQIRYLPQGRPANIKFQLEPIDSLPNVKDANTVIDNGGG